MVEPTFIEIRSKVLLLDFGAVNNVDNACFIPIAHRAGLALQNAVAAWRVRQAQEWWGDNLAVNGRHGVDLTGKPGSTPCLAPCRARCPLVVEEIANRVHVRASRRRRPGCTIARAAAPRC